MINDKLLPKWQLLASNVSASTSTSLPSSFDDVMIEVYLNQETRLNIHTNSRQLSSTTIGIRNGYYLINDISGCASINISTSSVSINEAYINLNNVKSNTTYSVYYKN